MKNKVDSFIQDTKPPETSTPQEIAAMNAVMSSLKQNGTELRPQADGSMAATGQIRVIGNVNDRCVELVFEGINLRCSLSVAQALELSQHLHKEAAIARGKSKRRKS